jgi:outer membrane protein OmpA-like peptidoglycan-associated protein
MPRHCRNVRSLLLVCALVLCAARPAASAGDAAGNATGETVVGREEFIRQLGGETPAAPPHMRLRGVAGTKEVFSAQQAKELAVSIHFKYDSADIADEFSRQQLQEAGEALASPALRGFAFEIGGHTDAQGGDEYNMELSLKRARAVREALCRGYRVDCAKLSVKGYGKTSPVASNDDEAGRAANRRVVFKRLQ